MSLINNYGFYTIKKDTKLFRKAVSIDTQEEMFLGFSPYATYSAYQPTKTIQIWETTCEIQAFLMVKGKNKGGKILSAVIDIYNCYFPSNQKNQNDYVSIKKYCKEREELINILKQNGITSWICSVENKIEMELFLFHSKEHHSIVVRHIETVDNNAKEIEDANTFNYDLIKDLSIISNNM